MFDILLFTNFESFSSSYLYTSVSSFLSHGLGQEDFIIAINEIERVGKGKSFITLDAYHDEKERIAMEAWNLTALTVMKVNQWKKLFKEIGYTGDYYWFIP